MASVMNWYLNPIGTIIIINNMDNMEPNNHCTCLGNCSWNWVVLYSNCAIWYPSRAASAGARR